VRESVVNRWVGEPAPTPAEFQQETNVGFEFLLEGDNVAKWTPRQREAGALHRVADGTMLELRGSHAGLGILFYDDP